LEDLKAFRPKEVLLAINLCKLTREKNKINNLIKIPVLKYQDNIVIKNIGHPLSLIYNK